MALRKYKPTTPGTRFKVTTDYKHSVTKRKPEKKLAKGRKRMSGRNNQGRRASRNRGGGHKRRYRAIDFKRDKEGVKATVDSIEYDPFRSAYISLLKYEDGEKRYILAPRDLEVGQTVVAGKKAKPEVGNALYLRDIPLGTYIHNIELNPGRGGELARGAGTFAQLTAKEDKYGVVRLPSGETRMILLDCKATIGRLSNADHILQRHGKAGRRRWMGRRPRVRGTIMNPIDHPMGGGESSTSAGHPRSRTGLYSKGKKTRNPKKASSRLILSRRKKKKKDEK